MVRNAPLRRNPKVYEDFYCGQSGQGIPVFVGSRNQRGHGIGSFFSGLGRMVLPWLRTGGKALLREGVSTGLKVANEALSGRNVGESLREHTRTAGQRLLQQAAEHVSGDQSGNGFRRKRKAAPPGEPFGKRIKTTSVRRRSHKRTQQKKKKQQYSDIFG